MIRSLFLVSALMGLAACASNGANDDDDGVSGLGDPLTMIGNGGACEEVVLSDGSVCTGIAGSERYLVADIALNEDGTIGGLFYVALFANTAWQATDDWATSDAAGSDFCKVAFQLSGTWEEGGGPCGACSRQLSYNMTVDRSLTDCPTDYTNDVSGSVTDAFWGIEEGADGNASSWDLRNEWAPNGKVDDKGAIFWSDSACEWYGTGECN